MAQDLLIIFTLLFVTMSPFFALALPICKGGKIGWALWALSALVVVLCWPFYTTTSDINYMIGDTINNNLKKSGFAATVAIMSVTPFSLVAHGLQATGGKGTGRTAAFLTVLAILAILGCSVLTYYSTLWFVKDADWGTTTCQVITDDHGRITGCAQQGSGHD